MENGCGIACRGMGNTLTDTVYTAASRLIYLS